MDFLGLLGSYKVNRPLTEQERTMHLGQHVRLNVEPHYQLSVIQMNSVYLDTVDKWFAWRGIISLISVAIILIGGVSLGGGAIYWLLGAARIIISPLDTGILFWNGIAMSAVALAAGSAGVWLLRKDAFSYTHYPIRFNRKNQMVHVFRTNGTVLSVPWKKIFFTLGHLSPGNNWEIRGHVLGDDNVTVLETFALSPRDILNHDDIHSPSENISSTDFLRAHWEFIRRYMEEGPHELVSQIKFCIPIDSSRESMSVSFERAYANFSQGRLLYWIMFPISFIISLFRIFAIRTSKFPEWPRDVQIAGVVEKGDAYAIRGGPNGDRIAIYPEAASAAGFAPKI